MNCLDFRRLVLANPRALEDPAREHAVQCPGCSAFFERSRELDADLFDALRVPAPDGLADRILLARGVRRRRWPWALAASALLAAVLTAWQPWAVGPSPGDVLGREAIAHIDHEPQAFTTVQALASDTLPVMLAEQGMRLVQAVGEVTYSRLCPLAGRIARHLVLRMPEGVVTVYLIPEDEPRERRMVEGGGYTALTLPAARGSIAVVAADPKLALAFERALKGA